MICQSHCGRRGRRKLSALPLLLFTILLGFLAGLTPAAASPALPVPVSGQERAVALAPLAEVLEDPGALLTLDQVRARQQGWQRPQGPALHFGSSRSAWWVRLRLVNSTAQALDMVFDLGTPNQDYVDWHLLDAGRPAAAPLLEHLSGDQRPFAGRLLLQRELGLPYRFEPGQSVDLYLRLASYDGRFELMPLTLSGAAAAAARERDTSLLLSLYHGGLLSLALFYLLLFAANRERVFGLYVLYLGSFLVNSFCFRGYDSMYLWPHAPDLHNRLVSWSANFSFAAGGLFAIEYLNLRRQLSPWLLRPVYLLVGLNLAASVAGLLSWYRLAAISTAFAGSGIMLVVYAISIGLMWRGLRQARFIVLAFSVLLLGVPAFYLESAGLLPASGWSVWLIQAGSALQMLLLAFGLADTMNVLKRQKRRAERRERAARKTLSSRLGQLVSARTQVLEEANHKLGELAITDELTAAFNRRHFNQVCDSTLEQARHGVAVALCIFDLDHFKAYNDRYGHPAGDGVLRDVSAAVQAELHRSGDLLFRLGGEEFAVLFTADSALTARQFGERLRLAISGLAIVHADNPNAIVTASFGIAWWNPQGGAGATTLQPRQLYAAADAQLYDAKKQGRNRLALLAL